MARHDSKHWQEIAVTPGEEIQNWLSRFGICEPVQPRDLLHPEPPAGLWNALNGGAVFAVAVALLAMGWLLLFHVIPALTSMRPG
jgi:hypothetical protein